MKTKKVKAPKYFLRNADTAFGPIGIPSWAIPYCKHIDGKLYTTMTNSSRLYEGTEIGGIYA